MLLNSALPIGVVEDKPGKKALIQEGPRNVRDRLKHGELLCGKT
jgi:hypothetical protein